MADRQHDRRCRICDELIPPDRCRKFPTANTCGGEPCAKVMRSQQSRYVPEYLPPADGSQDSADPLFRAKVRPCGRCGFEFRQTVHWRYFCPRCRQTAAVRHPEPDRTHELSTAARRSGGES